MLNPLVRLNGIYQKVCLQSKRQLTNPAPALKIVFRPGAIETIKRAKGWRTDKEMADALGITRAYVSMLAARRVSVSHNVIMRLAYLLGSVNGKWWVFYEIVNNGEPVDPNHPLWNQEKYEGRIPYARYSSSGELRKQDYRVEMKGRNNA